MNSKQQKQIILVVDDMPDNISLLSSILAGSYKVKAANSGNKAIKIAFDTPPDLILLDIMMPELDGYEVCKTLKNDLRTRHIPIIFITALGEVEDEKTGFDYGASDYITKPVSPPIVLARVKNHLALYDQNRELERKVAERTTALARSRFEIIRRLGLASEYKDNETGLHVERMSYYCHVLAKGIGLPSIETDIILNATPMHDVGKIGIPDKILQKPGRLTDDEIIIMQKHAQFGADIIGEHDDPMLQAAREVALTHHEKWDGTGYPNRLAGEKIPIIGRIAAVADVFDALTSERPYKEAWAVDRAVDLLRDESGRHFDPVLIEVFLDNLHEIIKIKESHSDKLSGFPEK